MKHALPLVALIATQAQAQIIYTDVIPDATYNVSGDTCFLDLNNNGQTDFKLSQFELPYYCLTCLQTEPEERVMVFPVATNVVADTLLWSEIWPQSLGMDRVIGADLSWSVTNGLVIQDIPGGGCMNGPFPVNCSPGPPITWQLASGSPRYLGLRFSIAGATHYGWARLSVPNAGEFTLMDYAYNSVPDEPILAGEGASTSIARIAHSSVLVSPNPFTSTLSVSMGMNKAGVATCTLRALTGQALLTRTFATTSGPSPITLDLASLAPGTYLLEMQIGGERIVRKVLKE
jgi:hypothetical protein